MAEFVTDTLKGKVLSHPRMQVWFNNPVSNYDYYFFCINKINFRMQRMANTNTLANNQQSGVLTIVTFKWGLSR